jgi:TPR repeat protein
MLGTIYLTGQGVEIDATEAEHWWRMAADQGYAAAQYNLGGMFSRKLSSTITRDEALDWLVRAAEQGHRSAGKELAELQAEIAAETAVAGEATNDPEAPVPAAADTVTL